jgi:hypothetical protein
MMSKDLAGVSRGLFDGTPSRYSSDESKENYICDMKCSGFIPFEDSYCCDLMGDDTRQSGMHHTVL